MLVKRSNPMLQLQYSVTRQAVLGAMLLTQPVLAQEVAEDEGGLSL